MSKKLTIDDLHNYLLQNQIFHYEIKGEYVDNKTKIQMCCHKVDIFGDEHGEFEIRPNDLLLGYGCPKCGGTKKMTNSEFIRKANYVHNNFFSYAKTEYKGSNEKVIITCPIHGDFEMKANNHLYGQNCPKCRVENITHEVTFLPKINASTKKLSSEEYKKRLSEVSPQYDLSKCEYINHRTKVILICKEHGEFEIMPQKALKGQGCAKCAKNKQRTTDDFINESKTIHGDKFDYTETKYVNNHTKVTLICKECGCKFQMEPANHITYRQGCPHCQASKAEVEIKTLLQKHNIEYIHQYRTEWLGRQSLDFYIPTHNIAIECQGIQHFQSIPIFGGDAAFQHRQELDKTKQMKCNEQGVTLLYYSNLKEYIDNEVILDEEGIIRKIL